MNEGDLLYVNINFMIYIEWVEVDGQKSRIQIDGGDGIVTEGTSEYDRKGRKERGNRESYYLLVDNGLITLWFDSFGTL